MIKTPTVFIIGAGASEPYHFPIGPSLKKLIIRDIGFRTSSIPQELALAGFSIEDGQKFTEAFYFSGRSSVDAFLEHRPAFLEIGKAAIARNLIQFEKLESLFSPEIAENWYEHLYRHMNTSFETFGENQVSFVTFNYDRSLEQYLFTALKHSYGKSDEDTYKALKSIPIVHVYGKLGYLPWEVLPNGGTVREYMNDNSSHYIKLGAQGIRIIHEEEKVDEIFSPAHELLAKAKRVVFIGFGYDQTNLRRLELDKYCKDLSAVAKIGSCFGLTLLERESLKTKLNGIDMDSTHSKALMFLRSKVSLDV